MSISDISFSSWFQQVFLVASIVLIVGEQTACVTETCIDAACDMRAALDETQDPCEDFYEFACGRWNKKNPHGVNNFYKIAERNYFIIKNALEKVNISNTTDAESKARIYYDACMDTNEASVKLGQKPLIALITDLGGWHMLPSTITNQTWDFQRLVQGFKNKYNLDILFQYEVNQEPRNSSKYIIGLDLKNRNQISQFPGHRDRKPKHEKFNKSLLDHMILICVLLGANLTEATRAHMKEVIHLELELNSFKSMFDDEQDLGTYYTIKQWQKEVPLLNWTAFFNDAFKLVNKTIVDTEKIVVRAPEYFKKITELIKKYSNSEEGQSKGTWMGCVQDTDKAFGLAVGAMFVREVFHHGTKTQEELLVKNIRNALKKNFKNLNWLDFETRQAVEMKADAITDFIGFPDFILDKDKLDKKFEELEVKPDEFFQNHIAYNIYRLKNNLKRLDEPVDKNEWIEDITPLTVNAAYVPYLNGIQIPIGIMQFPYYDGDNLKAVNYGGVGTILGHELTHAFDNMGRKYDRYGNVHQWWNNASIERFNKQAECIKKQYSCYCKGDEDLNGNQTLGEDIADHGGLKASFHAYLEESKTFKENQQLPGLKYNDRQLFFIAFGQTWCSNEPVKKLETDIHSPPKCRVNIPIANLKEFAKEFNCPIGSKMNPKEKCEVW